MVKNQGPTCVLDMRVRRLQGTLVSGDTIKIPFRLDATSPLTTLQGGHSAIISIRTATACTPHAAWSREPYKAFSLSMADQFHLTASLPHGKTARLYCSITVASGSGTGA